MASGWQAILMLMALAGCGGSRSSPIPSVPSPAGSACGVERWAVKTLADADATRVDIISATPTTVSALGALSPHCSGLPDGRTFPEEFRVYEVTGTVLVARNEDDRDVHLALADVPDGTKTLVAEVADPGCATTSPHLTMLSNAKLQYQGLGALTGKRVIVRGVGFYDFAHGHKLLSKLLLVQRLTLHC